MPTRTLLFVGLVLLLLAFTGLVLTSTRSFPRETLISSVSGEELLPPTPTLTNTPTPTETGTSTPTTKPTNTPTSTPTPTFTPTPTPEVVSEDKPVESGIFAASDQANMASQAITFRQYYKVTAAINSKVLEDGSDGSPGYQIEYDRITGDHWVLWGIVLPETDVSSLSKLAFDIKGQSGGEIPNVWLASRSTPKDIRNYVDIENYTTVTANWQRVEIPLTDFHVTEGSQQTIDLTRIVRVQIAFEWENMAGMVYMDGFAFEP